MIAIQDNLKLKNKVRKQLSDPEKQSLIRNSNSPITSPVVCVLKGKDGKGGVRLAVNYRYVNRHTVADVYPLSDVADIVQEVGRLRPVS